MQDLYINNIHVSSTRAKWSYINNICKEKRSYYLTMTYAHDKCAHDLT